MVREISGVQKSIKAIYPAAIYHLHFQSHQLQLVIVNSFKNVPQIRHAMALSVSWFLSGCAKRKNIIKSLFKENNKDRDFNLMYEAENHLFNQN